MPTRNPRICVRCQQPVVGNHDCRPTTARTRSQSSKITGTRRWSKARRDHLRCEPLCRECGAIAEQVDHIIPIAQGGAPWDRNNFQSLCVPCHEAKTAAEARATNQGTHRSTPHDA